MTVKKYERKELSLLTEQAKNGDQNAVVELYSALMPGMRRRALRQMNPWIRNPETADAIAEDVVTSCILEKLDSLKNNDYLIAWVTECLDAAVRLQNQSASIVSLDDIDRCGKKIDRIPCRHKRKSEIEKDDRIDLMKRCMESIRPEYAEILKMHYLHNLSYADIVAKTGMKMSTLIGRIQTARKELKYEMLARAE